jgi:D-alanyl-D-alanine carboxypeptidase
MADISEQTERETETSFTQKTVPSAHIPVIRQLTIALGLLLVVFSTSYIGTLIALVNKDVASEDVLVSARLTESVEAHSNSNPFDNAVVTARSAFVWDVKTGRALFNKNGDEVLPLASVTKLMTALVAYELLDDDTLVNISVDAIRTDGDSGLSDGETFSLKNLTDMVLVASSNDGAEALGAAAGESVVAEGKPEDIFVHAMNLRAEQLGLTNTIFNNASGLDISKEKAGAYSTARDISFLMEYIVTNYPDVTALTKVENTYVYNESGEYHEVENTNEIVNKIDGLIASKTGYTELSGGNLVIAFNAGLNHPIIVVVLGSTFKERFTDVLLLTKLARSYVATQP